MADYTQNIFEAVDSLVSRRIDSTPIDLTITGEIALLRNVDIGEYKVTYQGNTFSAFSLDPMTVYKLGEEVYVLVPKGDFSSKKIILGKAAFNDKVSYTDRQAMSNQWRTRGPNWLSSEWYWRNTDGTFRIDERNAHIVATNAADDASIVHPIANWRDYAFYREGMPFTPEQDYNAVRVAKTKIPDETPGDTAAPTGIDALNIIDKEFQLWGNQMDYIMVKANFETAFLNSHSTGEYGVWVECYTDNPKYGLTGYESEPQYNLMSFKLGFGDFNGARYSFSQPTPQYAVFPVPRGVLKGLVRVCLFQTDGWQTDIQPVSVNPTNPTVENVNGTSYTFEVPPAKLVVDRNNISATDIQIYWCEPVNLSDRLFWIKLDTIKGTSLFNTPGTPEQEEAWITSLPMQAHLMYGGEDVTSRETCKFVWFRQKYSALRDLALETEPDEFGNTWAGYLPEGENGWAPIAQMMKSPTEDPALGEDATYRLGTMNGSTFVEDADFHDALMVPIEEVPWQWKYMVVCYYNPNGGNLEEIVRSKQNDALIWETQTIRNISSIHDFELPMAMIGENLSDIFLRVRNNTLPWQEGVPYDTFDPSKNDPQRDWYCRWWFVSGQSYNAMQVDGDPQQQRYHKGRRRIDQLLLNEPITFKAQIYGKRAPSGTTAQQRVGDAAQVWPDPATASSPDMAAEYSDYEIANVERAIIPDNSAAVHVEFIGQRTHNYNADGKIRLAEMADRQYNIRAVITPRDESIVVFGVEWLAPDRTPLKSLSASEVVAGKGYTPSPNPSMLKDMWMSVPNNGYDARSLHYKVADTYDVDKVTVAENTFILRIQFLNGVVQEVPCEINYTKADSNGSQGSEWTAQIWPCNATETLDGVNAVGYTPWTQMIQEHPRPLVVNGIWNPTTAPTSGYQRNPSYRLFLRPFIRRNGEALESLNEASRYTYKVFWDVRYPAVKSTGNPRADASFGSFLELNHQYVSARSQADLGRDGDLATGTPYSKGTSIPAASNMLQAYTHSLDRENSPYNGAPLPTNRQPTFGAIEVQWANGTYGAINGRSFKDLNYSFVVKARIEIYYDGVGVASITSFHGVDVLFTNNSAINIDNFKPSRVKTNWPKEVMYTSTGLAPKLPNQILTFFYGEPEYTSTVTAPFPMTATPVNLTDHIQEINIDNVGLNIRGPYSATTIYQRTSGDQGEADVVSYEGYFFAVREEGALPAGTAPDRTKANDPNWRQIRDMTGWKLLPRAFYFFEEMDNGALATDIASNTGKWPGGATRNPDFNSWGNATFVRPIVYFISQFGNDHINGWDGKSIDLNEKNGTIFAPTIGAGWKHPFTNTFSGVIMGIDKSQLKNDYDQDYGGFSEDNKSQNPYMTGLFGYQDGVNSFGIMENGTAFFGRADRGGRIIIDGYNAQIYGGISIEKKTGLDANMRNRMRLSFIDFGGAAAYTGMTNADGSVNMTAVQAFLNSGMGAGAGAAPTQGLDVDGQPGIQMGAFPIESGDPTNPTPAANRWFGDFRSVFAPGKGIAGIGDADNLGEDPLAAFYGGYTTGHGFSTPAIEIGSYEDWVRQNNRRVNETRTQWQYTLDANSGRKHPYRTGRQLVRQLSIAQVRDLGEADEIKLLEIPGFRRFLVTYDGTLYAMNAFIMGTIMGSNIIGSQFFTDTGAGVITNYGLYFGFEGPPTISQISNVGTWSVTPPTTYQRLTSSLFDQAQTRKEFEDMGDGSAGSGSQFAVGVDGTVVANKLHLTGGSISIGSFHVMGYGNPGYEYGDVVSFGTMYLVGKTANTGLPNFGDIALEIWGDVYARGRLSNLGPVYFGGSWEKQVNVSSWTGSTSDIFPTSFNSPISILPNMVSPGVVISESRFPVKMGVWPLYFQVGDMWSAGWNNLTWVTLSNKIGNSGQVGDSAYMPGFSGRADQHFIGNDAHLSSFVTWRIDQLGMWSDAIIFTNRSWVSHEDDQALSFENHGLGYFGWWSDTHSTSSQRVWSLALNNYSGGARNFYLSTANTIRLTSRGSDANLRNDASGGVIEPATTSRIILETIGANTSGRSAAFTLVGDANYMKDYASLTAGSVFISARYNTASDPQVLGAYLDGFISINALQFDTPRLPTDERGRLIDRVPEYSASKIWIKSTGIAIDGAIGYGDAPGHVADINGGYCTTVRLNRSWDGSPAGGTGMPIGAGAGSTGSNFLGLRSGTVMMAATNDAIDGGPAGSGTIHIVSGALDNNAGSNEIYFAQVEGLLRLTGRTELSLSINAAGHARGTRAFFMTATQAGFTAGVTETQQVGIYARFA